LNASERTYLEGESLLLERHPELRTHFQSDLVDEIMPSDPLFFQIFAGFVGMGHQDVHAAIGINAVHMISGRKKWLLIPQSFGVSHFLYPMLSPWDHFSVIQ
jgi:hypothetical protein